MTTTEKTETPAGTELWTAPAGPTATAATFCNTWPFPNSDLDMVGPDDNAAVHRARGCCNGGSAMTAKTPEGFTQMTLPVRATGHHTAGYVTALCCDDCGSLVGNTVAHRLLCFREERDGG